MKIHKLLLLALGVVLIAGTGACSRESPAAASPRLTKPLKAKAAPSKKPQGSGKVVRIVFLDKEKCCDCTRKRIDASWKTLTDVVGFPPLPDVERIHMDTQAAKAAPYKKQRPVMVPPALYFYKGNKLTSFLQGEVTKKQIQDALK